MPKLSEIMFSAQEVISLARNCQGLEEFERKFAEWARVRAIQDGPED